MWTRSTFPYKIKVLSLLFHPTCAIVRIPSPPCFFQGMSIVAAIAKQLNLLAHPKNSLGTHAMRERGEEAREWGRRKGSGRGRERCRQDYLCGIQIHIYACKTRRAVYHLWHVLIIQVQNCFYIHASHEMRVLKQHNWDQNERFARNRSLRHM